jgi:ATP-dependent DNA helicase RecG
MDLETLLQYIDIGNEDQDIEFKSATWNLPKDVWETVSAFANTEGGYIILGVSETRQGLNISGVIDPNQLIKEFWDGHNNSQKLSVPICGNSDIQIQAIDENNLVIIRIPRASRIQRPVYINNNPMTGTYKRNYEGDYRCSAPEVKQMLRDASDDPQDYQILDGFDLTDLDSDTLKAFRQRFSNREPDHPWLAKDDKDLLYQLGGWRRDRTTGKDGLTIAGLLMFGQERSILDALPHHHLDYQEHFSTDPEQRWTYRLTLDGKWAPNLFNFYYRVYNRLVNDLAVPFQLDRDATRKGETHVHQALREALVNTLIHADHRSTRSIVIIKKIDRFEFSNPGRLRITIQELYAGGVTDPRNPNLQKMFQMLGLGEKAGSGFQKIIRAWKEQLWYIPHVSEKLETDLTSVKLAMVSLIPERIENTLRELVGEKYSSLTELERMILVGTHEFEPITNTDIQCFRHEHPRDIGECLQGLVKNGYLEKSGRGRGTRYTLPMSSQPDLLWLLSDSEHYESNSEHKPVNSEHKPVDSEHKPVNSEHNENSDLLKVAAPVRETKRVKPEVMQDTIAKLCAGKYLSLKELAQLLNRSSHTIRTHYIEPMLSKGLLELKYPDRTNHPQQAYKTGSPPP